MGPSLYLNDPKVQRTYNLPFFEKFRQLPSHIKNENAVLTHLGLEQPLAHHFAVEYLHFIKMSTLIEKVPQALEPVMEASEEATKDTFGRKRFHAHAENE